MQAWHPVRNGLTTLVVAGALLLGGCARPGGGEPAAAAANNATPPATATASPPAFPTPAVAPGTPCPCATPRAATPDAIAASPAAPAPVATAAIDASARRYVVAPGDTLALLARRFGTTVPALVAANELDSPDLILVGQELLIPDR